LLGAVRYDIENAQRISDGVGLRYQNDCMTAAVTYEQTNIQDQDIRPDQRVLVRLSLKYLGTYEYETDAFGGTYAEAPNTGVATSDVASTISN
jgi:LPS-assembly protein